jgi:CBS domain-containing protein
MRKNPITVDPQTSVSDVAQLMLNHRIGSVIITQDAKPVGIITERDLVRRVLAFETTPESISVMEVCSKPVIALLDLDSVEDAIELMKRHKIRLLVIVNRNDEVIGLLTTEDIGLHMKRLSDELAIDYFLATTRGKQPT